jgi:hypothetical protein
MKVLFGEFEQSQNDYSYASPVVESWTSSQVRKYCGQFVGKQEIGRTALAGYGEFFPHRVAGQNWNRLDVYRLYRFTVLCHQGISRSVVFELEGIDRKAAIAIAGELIDAELDEVVAQMKPAPPGGLRAKLEELGFSYIPPFTPPTGANSGEQVVTVQVCS